jgi:hypothetical protein
MRSSACEQDQTEVRDSAAQQGENFRNLNLYVTYREDAAAVIGLLQLHRRAVVLIVASFGPVAYH